MQTLTDYWRFAAIWDLVVLGIAAVNTYRYAFRWPAVYCTGMVLFAGAVNLAAYYHRGPNANAWGLAAIVGLALCALGAVGLPPRRPTLRRRAG